MQAKVTNQTNANLGNTHAESAKGKSNFGAISTRKANGLRIKIILLRPHKPCRIMHSFKLLYFAPSSTRLYKRIKRNLVKDHFGRHRSNHQISQTHRSLPAKSVLVIKGIHPHQANSCYRLRMRLMLSQDSHHDWHHQKQRVTPITVSLLTCSTHYIYGS